MFIKLKDISGFTVQSVTKSFFRAWDDGQWVTSPTYVKSDNPEVKYQKVFELETVEGTLTVSSAQFGQMLLAYVEGGQSDITGKTFLVKNNGKEGQDIRYYINGDYKEGPTKPVAPAAAPQGQPVSADDLPF